MPLTMIKAYGDDLADALSAGADAYLNATTAPVPTDAQKATVSKAKADIQSGKHALDLVLTSVTDNKAPPSAINIAKLIIADAQSLEPYVLPLLGAAGLYVPLALGVVQAFVDSLPPPPDTPPTPPAAFAEKARSYRRSH